MSRDPMLDRLNELTWPTPAGDRPAPAPGQVWALSWATTRAIAAITEVARHTVTVAMASPDEAGNEHTVTAALPEVGMDLNIWLDVTNDVRTAVLDHRIGDITPITALVDLPRTWAPIFSPLDDRALVEAELQDTLDDLAGQDWSRSEPVDLASTVMAAGLDVGDIAGVLSIAPGAARRLLQGQAEPSAEQASTLAEVLGLDPTALQGGLQVDEDFLEELDRPAVRPQLRLIARRDFAGDETAARRRYATQVMAAAARHRVTGTTDWRTLLHDALNDD